MKLLLLACLAIIVSACSNSNRPSFTGMSEMELAAYNRAQPLEKQVFCVEEANSSTFIRKRICQSLEEWAGHNDRTAMTLDVLNSRPSFALPSSLENRHSQNF